MAANGVVYGGQPGSLLGPNGQPLDWDPWSHAYRLPDDPLDSARPSDTKIVYRDIPLTTTAANWSINRIRGALQDHREGLFQEAALLCDSVFADDRVQATLSSRTAGVFSCEVQHRHGSRAFRKWWRKAFKKCCSQSVMSEIVRWAIVMGFAIAEIRWDRSVTPWQPYLVPWHPFFMTYRIDLREYQLSTMDGYTYATPGTGKWLVYTPHGGYRGWMQAVVRAIAEIWYIKRLAWRDWARFNERHGLPIIKAIVPAAGDPIQKQNYVASLSGIGQQAVVGLPQNIDQTGYNLELLEARDRGWETFMRCIDRCDMSIVLPILWQNLTTEVKEGSLAAAREHGDVRQNAIEFDNATLSECIYRDLARPAALFNFDDPDTACETTWDVTPEEDFVARSDAFVKMGQGLQYMRQAGLSVKDVKKLATRFGLDIGDVEKADPTQVAAKMVGAGGGLEDEVAKARSALRSFRHELRRLSKAA